MILEILFFSTVIVVIPKQNRDRITSKVLDATAHRPTIPSNELRSVFRSVPFQRPGLRKNHSHPRAAATREAGEALAVNIAAEVGLEIYDHSTSTRMTSRGVPGSRLYYAAKDLAQPSRVDNVSGVAVHFYSDVDYYTHFPAELNGRTIIVSTLAPTAVAKAATAETEVSYTFDELDQVIYTVKGGATYQHPLWDHSPDHVTATQYFLGIPYSTTTYVLERRALDEDHQLVLYAPIATHNLLACWLALTIAAEPPRRLRPYQNGVLAMQVLGPSGHNLSVGRPGHYHSTTLPIGTFSGMSALESVHSGPFHVSSAERILEASMKDIPAASLKLHAADVVAYVRSRQLPSARVTLPQPFTRVDYDVDEPEASDSMVAFMAPLVTGACIPVRSSASAARAVTGRVLDQQTKANNDPPPFVLRVMQSFVRHFAATSSLRKADDGEYAESIRRPAQVRRYEDSQLLTVDPEGGVSSFMKAESTTKVSDPRVISTVQERNAASWALYMISLANHCKELPCYAFGKTPPEIAQAVADICSRANFYVASDFSRYDGTLGKSVRVLERTLLAHCFPPEDLVEIRELHTATFAQRARLGPHRYYTGYSRLSGEHGTSVLNTVVNMFVTYLALRLTLNREKGLSPDDAWETMLRSCMVAGDDSGNCVATADRLEAAAKMMGLNLKTETIARGELGVTLVSRCFGTGVWYGNPSSCADPYRLLAKVHITPNLGVAVEPTLKLRQRALGILSNDANTPVLGAFARRVLELTEDTPVQEDVAKILRGYWASEHPDNGWPSGGMEEDVNELIELQMPGFDREAFDRYLMEAANAEDLLNPSAPFWVAPPLQITDTVVLNGSYETANPAEPLPPDRPKRPLTASKKSVAARRQEDVEAVDAIVQPSKHSIKLVPRMKSTPTAATAPATTMPGRSRSRKPKSIGKSVATTD